MQVINIPLFLNYFFSLSKMPRTPVASKILASATSGSATQSLGNVLEPEKISEIDRLLSCNGTQLAHIESQNELITSLYSKLGDLKQDILFKGLNIDLPRGSRRSPLESKGLACCHRGKYRGGKILFGRKNERIIE